MRDYAILKDELQSDLSVSETCLTSDMSIADANRLWLSKSFWKKFQDEVEPEADVRCLVLFLESNHKCRDFSLKPRAIFEEELIGEVKASFDRIFFRGPDRRLTIQGILDGAGVGPGASIDSGSTDFYTKLFNSTLSCTNSHLREIYLRSVSAHPSLCLAEKARHERMGDATVEGNRLSFVPKTSTISRGICTEPVLNMFFQKGIGSVLEDLLSYEFKINLDRQPELNRRMARVGSIDGSFGTIDLSSASDSIALSLLREILPLYVVQWLELTRSPCVTLPYGKTRELYMVSSMGNGFTFPLETLLFAVIVTSCYRVLGIRPRYNAQQPLNFGVFGDDIIVRKDAYAFVVQALELFGFRVNAEKSFNTGSFRESCGGDYFKGFNIRGLYCRSLKTDSDVYSIINRITRWSGRTGILLPKVLRRLKSWVVNRPIPYSAGDTEGIKTPYPPEDLVRNEHGGVIYHALVPVVPTIAIPSDSREALKYPKHLKRRMRNAFYNAEGILQAFLGGYIQASSDTAITKQGQRKRSRNGRISVRQTDTRRTKIQRRVTHNWADTYLVDSSSQDEDWVIVIALYTELGV